MRKFITMSRTNSFPLFGAILLVFNVFIGSNCTSSVPVHDLEMEIEHHLISSGTNRPDFNPYADSLDHFIYALHKGIKAEGFAKQVAWGNERLHSHINLLHEKGFIRQNSQGEWKPNVMVVTPEDGTRMAEMCKAIANQVTDSIESKLPDIISECNNLIESLKISFDSISFFILSNVLLDNFQIDHVEKDYLNSPRTPRHGKNYYYQLAGSTSDSVEVFGVYGNQFWCNDTICAGVYGNSRKRLNLENFIDKKLPLITAREYEELRKIAQQFRPSLISILKANNDELRKSWKNSVYYDEISYEEYFIWWYHFMYTEVTNNLAKRKIIKIPVSGNYFYLANY